MKRPGIVMLRPNGTTLAAVPFEVHVETEENWQGYNRINPFAGYQTWRKDRYTLVEDRRDDA